MCARRLEELGRYRPRFHATASGARSRLEISRPKRVTEFSLRVYGVVGLGGAVNIAQTAHVWTFMWTLKKAGLLDPLKLYNLNLRARSSVGMSATLTR